MSDYNDRPWGERYQSSFDGFLTGFAKEKANHPKPKYATNDEEIIAMVEKAMRSQAKKYQKVIDQQGNEITSLKKTVKKLRTKMRESALVTYAGEEVRFGGFKTEGGKFSYT